MNITATLTSYILSKPVVKKVVKKILTKVVIRLATGKPVLGAYGDKYLKKILATQVKRYLTDLIKPKFSLPKIFNRFTTSVKA